MSVNTPNPTRLLKNLDPERVAVETCAAYQDIFEAYVSTFPGVLQFARAAKSQVSPLVESDFAQRIRDLVYFAQTGVVRGTEPKAAAHRLRELLWVTPMSARLGSLKTVLLAAETRIALMESARVSADGLAALVGEPVHNVLRAVWPAGGGELLSNPEKTRQWLADRNVPGFEDAPNHPYR
jgi:hypothetical protein